MSFRTIAQGLDEASISFNKGLEYFKAERFDEAIEWLTDAISRNPQLADAYAMRGGAYMGKEKFDLALSDFNRSIEIDPSKPLAFIMRGSYYLDQNKDYDKSESDFVQAIKLDPEHAKETLDIIFKELDILNGKVIELVGELQNLKRGGK